MLPVSLHCNMSGKQFLAYIINLTCIGKLAVELIEPQVIWY
uniref:Uncharacterized protein n=1 Tax=Rhizophora mucronata TaxID=61149 RepID=A0A2P2PUS9_RHIMU